MVDFWAAKLDESKLVRVRRVDDDSVWWVPVDEADRLVTLKLAVRI